MDIHFNDTRSADALAATLVEVITGYPPTRLQLGAGAIATSPGRT